MDDGNYSFRWGVELFDNARTEVPNIILENYYRVPWTKTNQETGEIEQGYGISNSEMMFIINLASFKYESPKGKAMPSLTKTLRIRMGYKTNQGIINLQQGLIDKGLLIVSKRIGARSEYDFAPFSRAILAISQQNPSTKIDYSNPSIKIDSSIKIDGDSSTKIDYHPSTKIDSKKRSKEENQEKNARAKKSDPLADIFNGQNKVSESTSPNPQDQWFEYRDKAISIYVNVVGILGKDAQEQKIRKELILGGVAKRIDFSPDCWQRSIVDSLAHNVAPGNIARFFEVYDAGGDYNNYLAKRYPGNGYTQTTKPSDPEVKAVYK